MRRVLVTPAAAALAIGGQRHSVYAMSSSLDPYSDTIDDVRSILETATLPTGVEGAPTPTP